MSTAIASSTIRTNSLVGNTSRYLPFPVIYYGTDKRLTFPIYTRATYPANEKDRYTVISKPEEYRPDKVAFRAYGVQNFWWKIMEANGMYDIWDFKVGTTLWLPSSIY